MQEGMKNHGACWIEIFVLYRTEYERSVESHNQNPKVVANDCNGATFVIHQDSMAGT
jgi:hypothetical protein